MKLLKRIVNYGKKVALEEQPFNRVRNMVENARRRKGAASRFDFDETYFRRKDFSRLRR